MLKYIIFLIYQGFLIYQDENFLQLFFIHLKIDFFVGVVKKASNFDLNYYCVSYFYVLKKFLAVSS